jgi:hypothetical protein
LVDTSLVYVSYSSNILKNFGFFTFMMELCFLDMFSLAIHSFTFDPLVFAVNFPEFLYPLLNTTSDTRSFEYLRLTTLGVFGALVKVNFAQNFGRLRRYFALPSTCE